MLVLARPERPAHVHQQHQHPVVLALEEHRAGAEFAHAGHRSRRGGRSPVTAAAGRATIPARSVRPMTQQTPPGADNPADANPAAPIVTLGSSAPTGSAGSESTMTVL